MEPRRGYLWVLFFVSALAAIGLFFIPAVIIQPFKHQTPLGLAVALARRHRAPWGTLVAALAALGFAIALWSGSPDEGVRGSMLGVRWWRSANLWRRIVLGLVMVVVVFSTVMARLNYFEWMFHPVDSARFETASGKQTRQE